MTKKRIIPRPKVAKRAPSKRRSSFTISGKGWAYIIGGFVLIAIWFISFSSNTSFRCSAYYVYVSRGTDIDELADSLSKNRVIKSAFTFKWMASLLNVETLRPGMYRIGKSWGNYRMVTFLDDAEIRMSQLIDLGSFRSRKRTIHQLCQLSNIKEKEFLALLADPDEMDDLGGFTTESVYCIFRPGRYRIYKNTNPKEVLEYLACNYVQLWNDERRAACKKLDLSEDEVVILSSIVYSETKQRSEMATIAGVYINRLRTNMKLQSDPTVLFAHTSMDSRRVSNKQLKIDSDYNTYLKKGLPPGPICIVPTFVIDEVLKYDAHAYYYFCAKGDNSGCHNFSGTYDDHVENAKRYRDGLNKKKIYK
jgi:UPF0755 protein